MKKVVSNNKTDLAPLCKGSCLQGRLWDCKKILSIILSFCMLISITAGVDLTAYAENYSGTCGENVTWELYSLSGELVISGTGEMEDYHDYSESPWYSNRSLITDVRIESGVTHIGTAAFVDCANLERVEISDSVVSIGGEAFLRCNSLTYITFYYGCLSSIGESVFKDCTSLTDVVIPYSVTSIGEAAFYGCTDLTSITFSNSVISIGDGAFNYCTSLENVNYTGTEEQWSLISMGYYNTNLEDAAINYNYATSGACGESVNWSFNSSTGVLLISGLGEMDDYSVVWETPWHYNIPVVKSIIIDDGVTSIGNVAFADCHSLEYLTIPDGVTKIGDSTFFACTSLTNVTIPDSVTSISDNSFSCCLSLTSIEIPNGVTSISRAAFSFCTSLTSVTIPDSVTSIDDLAFNECASLTSVTIPNGVTSIGYAAFAECTSLTSVTIPDSVTSIGDYAFINCSGLTDVKIPHSVTSIGEGAFGYTGLTSVKIPSSVTSIGECAFIECTSLTSVKIPSSVTSVDHGAFIYCEGIEDVYYTGAEAEWNEISFEDGNDSLLNANIVFNYIDFEDELSSKGGSIRLSDKGLRFGFSFSECDNTNVQEYGFVYASGSVSDLTINTPGAKATVANNRITHSDDTTTFNLVFTNIPQSAYGMKISARAYVKIDGEYYYSDILVRSFMSVANAVLADDAVDESIKQELREIVEET